MKIFEDDPEMFVELQHVMAQAGFYTSIQLPHAFEKQAFWQAKKVIINRLNSEDFLKFLLR